MLGMTSRVRFMCLISIAAGHGFGHITAGCDPCWVQVQFLASSVWFAPNATVLGARLQGVTITSEQPPDGDAPFQRRGAEAVCVWGELAALLK